MSSATLEVSGADAVRLAADLHTTLSANSRPGESVSPVEVQRSTDIVIALVALVFTGVDTATTIWEWWHARRPEGTTVKILLSDGTEIDVSTIDRSQLEISFRQASSQQ